MIDGFKLDCLQSKLSAVKEREHYNYQLSFHEGSIKLNELKLYMVSQYQGGSEYCNILKNFLVQLELRKKASNDLQ